MSLKHLGIKYFALICVYSGTSLSVKVPKDTAKHFHIMPVSTLAQVKVTEVFKCTSDCREVVLVSVLRWTG